MSAEDEVKIMALSAEYERHLHAMQSGVKAKMEARPARDLPTDLKHLRVGVNSAMVNNLAVVRLLVDKGIITDLEFQEALTNAMREEKELYEKELSEMLNVKITLA